MRNERGITIQQMSDELQLIQAFERLTKQELERLRIRMNLDSASLAEVRALLAEQALAGCVDNYEEIDTG